jgi:hypothetical protein
MTLRPALSGGRASFVDEDIDKWTKWRSGKVESKCKSEVRGMGSAAVGGPEELGHIFATCAKTARANLN